MFNVHVCITKVYPSLPITQSLSHYYIYIYIYKHHHRPLNMYRGVVILYPRSVKPILVIKCRYVFWCIVCTVLCVKYYTQYLYLTFTLKSCIYYIVNCNCIISNVDHYSKVNHWFSKRIPIPGTGEHLLWSLDVWKTFEIISA